MGLRLKKIDAGNSLHREAEKKQIEKMSFMGKTHEVRIKPLTPAEEEAKKLWFEILDERAVMLGPRREVSTGVQEKRPSARGHYKQRGSKGITT